MAQEPNLVKLRQKCATKVLDTVRKNPSTSVRAIAGAVGGSWSNVHRILQREGLLTYHLQRIPSLFLIWFYTKSISNGPRLSDDDILASPLSKLPHFQMGGIRISTDLTCISSSTRQVFSGTRVRTHDTPATCSGLWPLDYHNPTRELWHSSLQTEHYANASILLLDRSEP
ncbi:hypothetical protein TNCV_1002761 [Trichonephila clavipes]|nr:hypothetical protein TNCV_1002761 [Trichonephila clavipes]